MAEMGHGTTSENLDKIRKIVDGRPEQGRRATFRYCQQELILGNTTMAATVLMPALSPTMEKGKLAKWLKKEGDTVKSGDILAEIETDKATMEIEAVDEGTLGKIMVADGTEDVLVNTLMATILAEGEKAGMCLLRQSSQLRHRRQPPLRERPRCTPPSGGRWRVRRKSRDPRVRLAPCQAPGQGKGHRSRSSQRLRPAWAHCVERC